MHKHRLERVLVLNDEGELAGLDHRQDMMKSTEHPSPPRMPRPPARRRSDRCRCRHRGARRAAGRGRRRRDRRRYRPRPFAGRAGPVNWVKKNFPQVEVIGGNIATAAAAKALVDAGADGVKVGIGPGSICTTRIVAGVGVPQITAVDNVATALAGSGVPMIADGGIRYSGDISKAIAAGANVVMLGGLFAGTEEAPGETVLFQGRSTSPTAAWVRWARCSRAPPTVTSRRTTATWTKLVPEGIEGRVPYKGAVTAVIHQLMGGLRASMGYVGCATIDEMRSRAEFVEITSAGIRESHVHDVQITKEAPTTRGLSPVRLVAQLKAARGLPSVRLRPRQATGLAALVPCRAIIEARLRLRAQPESPDDNRTLVEAIPARRRAGG